MSVPAQAGSFGFGIQSAKTTDAVLDSDAIKAAIAVTGQVLPFSVAAPANPAAASVLSFTVTTLIGSGDVAFLVQGTLAGEAFQDVVNIPATSPVGTRVFTRNQIDTVVSIQLLEQSSAGAVEIGAYTVGTGDVTSWFRYKAADINYGIAQDQRNFPMEVGDDLTPTGAYKAGAFPAGGATVQPRMEGDFGWMLKALMGDCSSSGAANTGYTHIFKFKADQTDIPWCSARKLIPGPIKLGEIGKDNKMSSIRFTIPPNGIVQARVDMVGCTPTLEDTPAWVWADVMEADGSVPLSCKVGGFVKFPASGSALPIQSVICTMVNNLSSPQQEMIIGNPFPDDLAVLSRAMTLQCQLKWKDPVIYEQCVAAASGAGALPWSDQPYTTTFQCKVIAPADIPNTAPALKYSLVIDATLVSWVPNGSPILAGGDLVILPLVGTVLRPAAGDYATFTILNGQANYN